MTRAIAKTEPTSLFALIARAAKDPSVDVQKFETLVRIQREIQGEQAKVEFNQAMNRAQEEIQPVARTTENTQTKSWYAKLEAVDAAIRPIYLRHGFALSYDTVEPLNPGQIRMQCRCTHIGGHSEVYHREAAADTLGPKGTPVKTALHGGASTETFLKRYLTCGIFNVVFRGHDDDGVRGGAELITETQVTAIVQLIHETKSNLDAFLKFMEVGALVDIRVLDYPKAINALMRKKKLAQNPAATSPGPPAQPPVDPGPILPTDARDQGVPAPPEAATLPAVSRIGIAQLDPTLSFFIAPQKRGRGFDWKATKEMLMDRAAIIKNPADFDRLREGSRETIELLRSADKNLWQDFNFDSGQLEQALREKARQ